MNRCLLVVASSLAFVVSAFASPAAAAPRCFGEPATIVGTERADVIRGTPGDDVIITRGGGDRVDAGDGDDRICTGRGDDYVEAGGGNDRVATGADGDTVHGGRGADVVSTGAGAVEALFGGPGDDELDGGPGRFDGLIGGPGDDRLDGGPGLDLAYYFDAPRGVTGDLASRVVSGFGADRLRSVEGLVGSNHDDRLAGDEGSNLLVGQEGDDRLEGRGSGPIGTLAADVLDPGPGDDLVDGGPGGDLVRYDDAPNGVTVDLAAGTATGWGADGLSGIEAVVGTPFADVLSGDAGDNAFVPGDGDDVVDGGAGVDELVYEDAFVPVVVDLALGVATGWGSDAIAGIEDVRGTGGPDRISGDAGPNRLVGGGGADTLEGRGGDDVLIGADGRDDADGGEGQDACEAEAETACELEPAPGGLRAGWWSAPAVRERPHARSGPG